jgi:hypothetical protein
MGNVDNRWSTISLILGLLNRYEFDDGIRFFWPIQELSSLTIAFSTTNKQNFMLEFVELNNGDPVLGFKSFGSIY